ncbi:hypothetical protein JGH11_19235 [Dysgonomonas sp. Marseille-P4677]|uniref:hypothetical protein n=1 Tax=Dysgonomonas sp. Marseille-P4677 TaxID=2364790 RepID=UPI001912D4FF|nr:hypothetical protein [Dysgonomonas sp. Marseille-P4677]MBK5723006.1 hypothetical protein [Dysgonomonas sp. Marseille-P4677]
MTITSLVYHADIIIIIVSMITITAYLAFAVLLIAYSDLIISFLKLDKGFDDEKIEILNINMQKLVAFAVIVVGGILIVHNFSLVFVALYNIFLTLVTNNKDGIFSPHTYNNIYYTGLIDFVIGLLLVMNYKRIALYVTKKSKQ